MKVMMNEEAALAGFCTVCKENLGFQIASANKRSFSGFKEAEESVKQHQTGYEHPWSEAEEEAVCLVVEADDYAKMKKVSLFRFF